MKSSKFSPLSLQKHELQSCFHVVPGVHSFSLGKVLLDIRFSAIRKHQSGVQSRFPFSFEKKFIEGFSRKLIWRNFFLKQTWANAIITSIVPLFTSSTNRLWWLNSSLFMAFCWTRTTSAKPTDAICCTSTSIAILQKVEKSFRDNWKLNDNACRQTCILISFGVQTWLLVSICSRLPSVVTLSDDNGSDISDMQPIKVHAAFFPSLSHTHVLQSFLKLLFGSQLKSEALLQPWLTDFSTKKIYVNERTTEKKGSYRHQIKLFCKFKCMLLRLRGLKRLMPCRLNLATFERKFTVGFGSYCYNKS